MKGNGRLGLLGMRERLEMVGGKFSVASQPGQGTTVTAQIPLLNDPAGEDGK
jgi:signal transduction histidine kinase